MVRGLVVAAPTTPEVWVPPDEDAIGVSRRQFLNRATVSLTGAGLTTFAAAGFVAFLWPTAKGGFGGKINVGKIDDVVASIQSSGGFFYNATARSWVTAVPVDALPKAKGVPAYKPLLGRHGGTASSRCTRSARTSVAACRNASAASGSSARATVRSTTVSVRRRVARPLAAWITSQFTVSAAGDVVIDTGTVFPGPPIGTNTTGQEAEGPHCIGGGGGHG